MQTKEGRVYDENCFNFEESSVPHDEKLVVQERTGRGKEINGTMNVNVGDGSGGESKGGVGEEWEGCGGDVNGGEGRVEADGGKG